MDFQNKKITIMGLGLLGRGIGVVKYLVGKGAKVTVTDLKSAKELKSSVDELKKFLVKAKRQNLPALPTGQAGGEAGIKNKRIKIYPVRFILDRHRLEDFVNADMVFKAAGVPLDSIYIREAKCHDVPVVMDDALFGRETACKIIGITGTRGKTTTSTLIYELAKATGRAVHLAGNIKGTATLPLLDKVKKNDLAILELSSWQLQGWRDLKISPHIAVVTNIYRDHMNYYKNDIKKYIRDKAAIFENQTENDYLVLNKNCPYCREFAKKSRAKVIWFSADNVPKSWGVKILGKHNLENIAAAMAVGKLLGLDIAKIKGVVEDFHGIDGRLQFVKEVGGVKYYNDTTATMPEATIAALEALAGKRQKIKNKRIILIVGGADKNLDFKDLAPVIKKYAKAVVLLTGTATPKLQKQLLVTRYSLPVTLADNMPEAVKSASKLATRGDIVLLSPAAASFGMFKNEFDRGEQFLKEVKKLNYTV